MSLVSKPYTWDEMKAKLGLTPERSETMQVQRVAAHAVTSHANLNDLLQKRCVDGERTDHLTRLAGKLLAEGFSYEELMETCRSWNSRNIEPLDDEKVFATCESIYKSDLRNHPERHQDVNEVSPLFDLADGDVTRFLTNAPLPRRWLIKDLVVLGKVGAIVAPGGSSKSQLLLQLAVSVATGVPLASHWEIGEPGGVLMFCAEDDNDEIHRRLTRVIDHLTATCGTNSLAGLQQNLKVFSTVGKDMLLTKRDSTAEVSLTVTLHRMIALAKQVPDLKLIVIDPASRFRGGDENKNEDATRFVEALETLAKHTGATVLIAHHTNKGSYNPDAEAAQGASRGASALTDGLRFQMNLGKPSDKQVTRMHPAGSGLNRFVLATVTKTNYSAYPEPVLLERLDNGYLQAINAQQAVGQAQLKAVAGILRVVAGAKKPISARQLEDRHGGVQGALGMAKLQVRKHVKIAIELGLLSGADRKPLVLTAEGKAALGDLDAKADDGMRRDKQLHRVKTP